VKRRAALSGVVVAVLLGGCSSGDDGDDGGGGGDGLDLEGAAIADVASLPLPPDADDGPVTVAFGDLAQAAELAGVDLDGADEAGEDEQRDVLNGITGVMYDPSGGDDQPMVSSAVPGAANVERLVDVDEFTEDVGWNLYQVRRFAELQMPPDDVTILRGDFDEDALDEALGEAEDGVWTIGTPGEVDVSSTTPARPLGEGLLLALDGDRLVVAKTEEGLAAVLGGDDGPVVGDDPVLSRLAGALGDAGAYSGMLVRGGSGGLLLGEQLSPEQAEAVCEDALPGPFAGVATGIVDDDGPVFLIAYVTADDEAAEATAEAVEQLVTEGESMLTQEPWSERLTVDEVTSDGNVALARLRPAEPGPPAIWQQILFRKDNLVAHC
jgi:hypothetical protein